MCMIISLFLITRIKIISVINGLLNSCNFDVICVYSKASHGPTTGLMIQSFHVQLAATPLLGNNSESGPHIMRQLLISNVLTADVLQPLLSPTIVRTDPDLSVDWPRWTSSWLTAAGEFMFCLVARSLWHVACDFYAVITQTNTQIHEHTERFNSHSSATHHVRFWVGSQPFSMWF